MAERVSPTVRRWVLANRLRGLREAAGLSIEEVASHLLCSPSKISRLETAARRATQRDVRDLCALYRVSADESRDLMALVSEASQRGWWQSYDEVASRSATYIGLEDSASSLEQYETVRIPGLLQTPDYTRALMRGIIPSLTPEGVDQYVASRAERQLLLQGEDRPTYWVVLDEAALRRQVGGPKVMSGQLQRLSQLAQSGAVTLQVVPFEAGAHAGMEGTFTVLQFAGTPMPDVVYIEGRSGQLFLHRPADIALYQEMLDYLRAVAESPDATLDRVQRLASNLDS